MPATFARVLELFLRMLIIGVAVAAPVGAMAILSIQRTLAFGWRAGVATGAGIASADALFAALAAFGVTAISEWLVSFQVPLRIIGGAGLIWLGLRALRQRARNFDELAVEAAAPSAAPSIKHARLFISAAGLTLTNPMTIMAFGAIFAGAGLIAQASVQGALVVTLGVALGSLLWWLVLVTGVWMARHALKPRAMVMVNGISGIVLIGFGVIALGSAVLTLI